MVVEEESVEEMVVEEESVEEMVVEEESVEEIDDVEDGHAWSTKGCCRRCESFSPLRAAWREAADEIDESPGAAVAAVTAADGDTSDERTEDEEREQEEGEEAEGTQEEVEEGSEVNEAIRSSCISEREEVMTTSAAGGQTLELGTESARFLNFTTLLRVHTGWVCVGWGGVGLQSPLLGGIITPVESDNSSTRFSRRFCSISAVRYCALCA
jgi:hypothetical protein